MASVATEKAQAQTKDEAEGRGLVLIPEPVRVDRQEGTLVLPVWGRVSYQGPDLSDGRVLAEQLLADIADRTAGSWDCSQGDRWTSFIDMNIDPSLGEQAYRVDISQVAATGPGESRPTQAPITVAGGDLAGLRYGVQTLRQIIRQAAPALPLVHIEDKPVFPIRSYYLDVTRGRVPSMDWLKSWADRLCLYKYNQVQLYIEHSFAFDGLSEAWRGTSPLTPRDIQEFDDYCLRLGLELVPSVSTFGHHYVNLRTQTLRELGEFPEDADRPYSLVERQEHHTLNITLKESFEFSKRLIDAYAPLFHSRKFNIGADETFDLGKGRSKQEAARVGVASMYADYVMRLCDYLRAQGREPMYWGDIAVEVPGVIDLLPKGEPLLNWLYDPKVDDSKVRMVADTGLPQYVCSAVHGWNSLLPNVRGAWSNISRLSAFGQRYGAVGNMVTDWGDYGHVNDPRMAIPGLIYGAQYGWNPQGPDFEEMNRRVSRLEYGDASGRYMAVLVQACESQLFTWADLVRYRELDDGHGGVNRDLSLVVKSVFPDGSWDVDALTDLGQARRRYLELMADRLAGLTGTNRALADARLELSRIISRSQGRAFDTAQAQLLAIEGQALFNRLGWTLAAWQGLVGRTVDDNIDQAGLEAATDGLAGELEVWLESYRAVWRQVSRESELRRVSDVVWRYADMLRAMARAKGGRQAG
ncbi:glycosyl hydrolase [Bifidobacterium aemilianum]|uniref:beta-N-acetylhexosaminidase n=1 Tax=Bifidobacterium aemilianum TaxID=2493120 RepID=A0A366K7F1_9BIFI|nr:glycoside hydrolase family 20 zincin-like fold domain-containing protein [Bifidobacterium aemilianum]RBP97237.1 glycosyl hydrolase [Bifidobacterium aemilianum]